MSGFKNRANIIEDENSFSAAINSREQLTTKTKDNFVVELKELKKAQVTNADYEPYDFREVEHPTSNYETLFHLLKGSLGTGILAMPLAFFHSGWLLGIIATAIIGSLCTYCIHLLVKAEYQLCKRRQVPSMTYPATAEAALQEGPPFLQKLAPYSQHTCNTFLLLYQLGCCCVYTVFIAENLKEVCDLYLPEDVTIDINLYMLIILLPLVLINYIRNLKLLAPFSTIANVITIASFGIILYYLIEQDITLKEKEAFGHIKDYPLFFGTVLFALEAIGMIMPLENEMKTPRSFGGPCGVLNIGMVSIVLIYIGMGLFGYLAFGDQVLGSITFNIGNDIPAQVAKVMLSFAMFVTHSLQMYVAIDITWNEYLIRWFEKNKHQLFWEYFTRTALVLITFILAVAIPHLDLIISLIGAFCLSALGLAIPAVVDISTNWYTMEGIRGKLSLARNIALILFGVFGLIIGTYTSIRAIVEKFTESK